MRVEASVAGATHIHLPDAPGGAAGGPGTCPKCGMALEPVEVTAPATKTEYTCPMHPEIVRDEPGTCPICGMALEPRTVAAEGRGEPRTGRHDAAVLGVASPSPSRSFILAMGQLIPGNPFGDCASPRVHGVDRAGAGHAGGALGRLAVLRARLAVARQPQPEHVHADRASASAWPTSTASSRRSLPASSRPRSAMPRGKVGVYFEAAAVIIALVLLGQVLELRARSQTGGAIQALLGLAPKTARLVRDDGSEEDVPLEQVQVGDRLRVRPGEKVPVDGVSSKAQAPSTSR